MSEARKHFRLVACVLLAAGCGGGSPAGAVRQITEASIAGDRDSVVRLLGPRTLAMLQIRARQRSGDTRNAADLVGVGWFTPDVALVDVREQSRHGAQASVEVTARHAGKPQRYSVECVRGDDGAWRVELPASASELE